MTSARPNVLDEWNAGWNRIQTPLPRNAYRVGKNLRLTETSIPERRAGTTKKNTVVACALAAMNKPILNAMQYNPTGRTTQWVAAANEADGSNSDIFFSSDGTEFTAQSQSLTADAMPYFAVFTILGGSGSLEDHLFLVNGYEEKEYDPSPAGGGWASMSGTPTEDTIHICVHENRIYQFKNNYAYFSTLAGDTFAWNRSTQYLDFAHGGEVITCGQSFDGDLFVFRNNSFGVLRGKDPYSGVQVAGLVKHLGCPAPKTLIEGLYRGQKVLYFLSLHGLALTNGYIAKVIDDERVNVIGLMNENSLSDACAGLYENRYLMLSFRSSSGSVNDVTVVYDTYRDIFISKDEGYYPQCYWNIRGSTDKGELYFGTSNDLGLIYKMNDSTDDDSPVTDGTDVEIDVSFQTGPLIGRGATQQERLRGINMAMDTSSDANYVVKLIADDDRQTIQRQFSDARSVTTHTWGETGFKWGADGVVWGQGVSDKRTVFKWKIHQKFRSPYEYKVQIDMENQDKTFRLQEIEVLTRDRTRE